MSIRGKERRVKREERRVKSEELIQLRARLSAMCLEHATHQPQEGRRSGSITQPEADWATPKGTGNRKNGDRRAEGPAASLSRRLTGQRPRDRGTEEQKWLSKRDLREARVPFIQ